MIKIIGGSGFIGTRLAQRLRKSSNEFSIIDKVISKSFSNLCEVVNIMDIKGLGEVLYPDSVLINLAAEHRDDVSPKSLYDDVNVKGARNICEVAEEKNISTIIFTSSVAVYGFAPVNTDENGEINYFNDYGRTKYEAEIVYKQWQAKDPQARKLVIIRPTVVFGENNRGNVYNLFKQISMGKFIMIGNGNNSKSMAYVENLAAFIEYSLSFKNGVHIYNYIDKPDITMNVLIGNIFKAFGKKDKIKLRVPYLIAYLIGKFYDILSKVTGKKFTISSIRIKKFCMDSMYNTNMLKTGFIPPVKLEDALLKTIKYEFIDNNAR